MKSILASIRGIFRNQSKRICFKKPKTFSLYFVAFLETTRNFYHFRKKIEHHSLSISEIIHSKKRGYLNA